MILILGNWEHTPQPLQYKGVNDGRANNIF